MPVAADVAGVKVVLVVAVCKAQRTVRAVAGSDAVPGEVPSSLVTITVTSDPPGATVRPVFSRDELGRTPLVVSWPSAAVMPLWFRFPDGGLSWTLLRPSPGAHLHLRQSL